MNPLDLLDLLSACPTLLSMPSWLGGDVFNRAHDGYLLRKDLHALYDAGELTITEDGRVGLSQSAIERYRQFWCPGPLTGLARSTAAEALAISPASRLGFHVRIGQTIASAVSSRAIMSGQ
jgi:hypothetical protein